MRTLYIAVLAAGLGFSGAAFAQSNTSPAAPNNTGSQQQVQQPSLATVNRVKQDLQQAGFSDVNVVAESFVVQAKTKDGDPVLMTIGPHGMTVFEALNASSSHPSTTGSMSNSSSAGTSGTSGSTTNK